MRMKHLRQLFQGNAAFTSQIQDCRHTHHCTQFTHCLVQWFFLFVCCFFGGGFYARQCSVLYTCWTSVSPRVIAFPWAFLLQNHNALGPFPKHAFMISEKKKTFRFWWEMAYIIQLDISSQNRSPKGGNGIEKQRMETQEYREVFIFIICIYFVCAYPLV